MRLAFLATQFADYSMEAAMVLRQSAQTLLLADRMNLDRDGSRKTRQALQDSGQLFTFRQNRLPYRVTASASVPARLLMFRPDLVIAHEHAHPHITWIMSRVSSFA